MENLKKLINVKSIITIALTALFMILAIKGTIDGNAVMTIYTTVIAFYFGTQHQKKTDENNNENKEG